MALHWLGYLRHCLTKKCNTKKARWLNLFDSDNFGRQWLTRGARTGAAPENAPLRLAMLWYNYENALPMYVSLLLQNAPPYLPLHCGTTVPLLLLVLI